MSTSTTSTTSKKIPVRLLVAVAVDADKITPLERITDMDLEQCISHDYKTLTAYDMVLQHVCPRCVACQKTAGQGNQLFFWTMHQMTCHTKEHLLELLAKQRDDKFIDGGLIAVVFCCAENETCKTVAQQCLLTFKVLLSSLSNSNE